VQDKRFAFFFLHESLAIWNSQWTRNLLKRKFKGSRYLFYCSRWIRFRNRRIHDFWIYHSTDSLFLPSGQNRRISSLCGVYLLALYSECRINKNALLQTKIVIILHENEAGLWQIYIKTLWVFVFVLGFGIYHHSYCFGRNVLFELWYTNSWWADNKFRRTECYQSSPCAERVSYGLIYSTALRHGQQNRRFLSRCMKILYVSKPNQRFCLVAWPFCFQNMFKKFKKYKADIPSKKHFLK